MKKTGYYIQIALLALLFSGCNSSDSHYDASGSFEAIERTISAEATGKILSFPIHEGETLKTGQKIGQIDIAQLSIQREQIQAVIDAIHEKTKSALPDIDVVKAKIKTQRDHIATLKQELVNLEVNVKRFQDLSEGNAIPKKKLDDILGQKLVLEKQLDGAKSQLKVLKAQEKATQSNIHTQNTSILSEIKPKEKKLALINEQIKDAQIINDFKGTVTTKMAYAGEFARIGQPLYKIADLDTIILRVYISGNQLAKVKLDQKVKVKTDDGKGGFKTTEGTITWISSKAEFTPKTIRTKDERADLVYAIKVRVKNDGTYKIGMYGEIKF